MHAETISHECKLVKTCILGMMTGKRRRGHHRMQYIDNIKKWTRTSLEQNMRMTSRRERSSAAGAANVITDAAELGEVQNAALINVRPNIK